MPRPPFPAATRDTLAVADWMELSALARREASFAEVERGLKRSGAYGESTSSTMQEDGEIDAACADVFSEIQGREKAAAKGYPFELRKRTLTRRAGVRAAYAFCLCLSAFRDAPPAADQFPRRLFEELSTAAAAEFVGGRSFRFGSPRQLPVPGSFSDALEYLAVKLGEGAPKSGASMAAKKDDHLDVVAWRDFEDRRAGKLVLFAQCASGVDWQDKLSELQHGAFLSSWFSTQPPSRESAARGFFVPHRLKEDEWDSAVINGGIVFDRCRIAELCSRKSRFDDRPYARWVKAALAPSS